MNGNQFCLIQGNIQINATVSFSNFDQYEDSSFQMFLQSYQAGWDKSAKKLKIETILLFHYMFISSQLWLTSHPTSTMVLLGTGTPNTSREIYSEDADGETRTRNPLVITDALAIELNSSKDIAVRHQLDKLKSFPAIAFELFRSVARALGL